jgi:CheY-like chemotaxis protein
VLTKEPFVLQFDINDTGIGLSAEQQKNLFKPFMQADLSTSRKYGGTGLGLAICKKLVELMGGKLWVNSRLGRGSTFSFTVAAPHVVVDTKISAEASPQAVFELTAADMKVFRKLRVAIIDDNATNCMALDALMQQCGVEMHMSFRLGMDGINEMRASEMKGQPFNLLLLDYHMPLMDGIEVCNSLMRCLKNMPVVIALSSFIDHNLLSKVPGITACTSKPIRQQHLLYMICRSLMAPVAMTLDEVDSPAIDSIGSVHSSGFDTAVSQFEGFALPKTVLVVEDNAINQMVLCALLSAAEVKVLVANNGVEAVQMEAEFKDIELILMDLHMPVLDGIQATELLRRRGCKLPVLAVTADITSEAKQRCAPLMQGFLMKPVQKLVLFEAMSRVWAASLSNKPRAAPVSYPVVAADIAVPSAAPVGLITASFPAFPLILLADDDRSSIMFAEHLLRTGVPNCEIVSVGDGTPAVAATLLRKFNIIFLDLRMPALSGIDAALQIRGDASNPNCKTPIICITGDDDTDTVHEIRMAGMNGVIGKPFLEGAFISAWKEHGCIHALAAEAPPTVVVEIDLKITESLPAALVTTLRAMWKVDVQLLMQALNAAIATESWKAAHTAAHTIKGSSAQVGAVTVSRMAAVLQMCSVQSEAKEKASLLLEAIAETSKRL